VRLHLSEESTSLVHDRPLGLFAEENLDKLDSICARALDTHGLVKYRVVAYEARRFWPFGGWKTKAILELDLTKEAV